MLFTVGREGLLTEKFGRVHPTYLTPFAAILVSVTVIAVVRIIAVFVGDGLWRAMEVLLVVAATYRLRLRRQPWLHEDGCRPRAR